MCYLFTHREKYYFRKRLPRTKINLVVSLKTDNKSEANFLTAIIDTRLKLLFKDFKLNFDEEVDYIKKIVKEYVDEAKDDYGYYSEQREQNYKYTTKKGKVRLGSHPKAIEKAIEQLTNMLYSDDKKISYTKIADSSKIKNKFESALRIISKENQNRFIDEVIKGEIEILHFDKSRNEQRTKTPTSNPTYIDENIAQQISIYNEPNQVQPQKPSQSRYYDKTARELLDIYIATLTIKEPFRDKRSIEILLDIVDKEYLIDFTHEDMDNFFKDLLFLPNLNTNKKLFKDYSFKKIIVIAKKEELKPLAESTLASKIIQINKFLDYAFDREYLDRNRLKNKGNLDSKPKDIKRKEYRDEQLNILFNSSKQYTDRFEENLEKFPSRIWIPLLLLFQGCRTNEIAQLYLDQIIIRDDIYFLKIAVQNDDQQIKNPTSKRTIPIHQTLIDLGILKFIEKQREAGHTRLFSELYHTTDKGYGQAYSKIFNEDKKNWLDEEALILMKDDVIKLDLHSFRHNFSGSLKGSVEDGILNYLAGHKNSSESQNRYGKFRSKLKFETINKCKYPNLNLSKLKIKLSEYYK